MSQLKVIQINIRSLMANKNILELYLDREEIDIVLISETWLKNSISFSGFHVYTLNRADGYGGVAILVKNHIFSKQINFHFSLGPVEAVQAEILINNVKYTFLSLYIPPNLNSNAIKPHLKAIFDNLNNCSNTIVGGDLNGQHPIWDNSNRINSRGYLLAELITQSHLHIINTGEMTRLNLINHTGSAIDVTCASPDLGSCVEWEVQQQHLGSDHLPILIKITLNSLQITRKRKHIQYNKLAITLPKCNFDNTVDIEDFETQLETIINMHTKETISKHTNKSWWNQKIKNRWIIKEKKQQIYNANKTEYTATELNSAVRALRLEIKKSKKASWDEFTSEIHPSCSIKDIYAKINLFNNKKKKSFSSFLDSRAKYNELVQTNYTDINYELKSVDKQLNNDIVSSSQISEIINSNKNTAGGINNISNKILKMLSQDQIEILTKHLNNAFNKQVFPKSWKQIKAIAFPKPNKDESNINNYRIISLLNVFHKLFGKIIKAKVLEHINNENLLPQDSYGFRGGVGINEYCIRLVQILEQNKKCKYISAVITIDIAKAFDKVNSNTLLAQMEQMAFDKKYLYWISESIRSREITIGNDQLIVTKTISEGVPQGDVLSPILFNLYTTTIHNLKDCDTEILQYADDFTFIIKDRNINEIINKCNIIMTKIKQSLDNLNFKINVDKCKYMFFNCKNDVNVQVTLDNVPIKREDSLKILGVTFDQNLNFYKHTRETRDVALKFLNILKIFNYKRGGAHPKSMLNVYSAIIKSRTMYAMPVVSTKTKKNNKVLQVIHNAAIRHCMGLTKTTPVSAIIAEAGDWPVEHTAELSRIKFIAKHIYNNTEIGKDILNHKSTHMINTTYSKYPILLNIPVITVPVSLNQSNLETKCDILNYNKNLPERLRKISALETINKYTNHYHIYTDGSKTDDGVGIGIFFDDTKEGIHKHLQIDISIKTTEIIAILTALKLAVGMHKSNIVVFTDSRSSCISIHNAIAKYNKSKYYENMIIELVNRHNNTNFTIQWIPAHVGIPGNESADKLAAKRCTNSTYIEKEIKIPVNEAISICKKQIHSIWTNQFSLLTQDKGKFHANIIQNHPTTRPWFHKTQHLNSTQIKQLTRLRTGHTFDQKHLHTIKLADTNICRACNTIEDFQHIITHCTQHQHLRHNYPDIFTRSRDLSALLQAGTEDELKRLTCFISDTNSKL